MSFNPMKKMKRRAQIDIPSKMAYASHPSFKAVRTFSRSALCLWEFRAPKWLEQSYTGLGELRTYSTCTPIHALFQVFSTASYTLYASSTGLSPPLVITAILFFGGFAEPISVGAMAKTRYIFWRCNQVYLRRERIQECNDAYSKSFTTAHAPSSLKSVIDKSLIALVTCRLDSALRRTKNHCTIAPAPLRIEPNMSQMPPQTPSCV